jgi:hypothetical protein
LSERKKEKSGNLKISFSISSSFDLVSLADEDGVDKE